MDALTVLHNRVSASRLGDPAPDQETLQNIYRAALRAADHALLRPWRFLVIEGDARDRLGELMVRASLQADADLPEAKQASIRSKALRAPVIIVAICSPVPHPNVPQFEQEYSTAAAVQNMLNAAYAQQVGAIWRTGPLALDETVRAGLGVQGPEKIIGFLYLGQLVTEARTAEVPPPEQFFASW